MLPCVMMKLLLPVVTAIGGALVSPRNARSRIFWRRPWSRGEKSAVCGKRMVLLLHASRISTGEALWLALFRRGLFVSTRLPLWTGYRSGCREMLMLSLHPTPTR